MMLISISYFSSLQNSTYKHSLLNYNSVLEENIIDITIVMLQMIRFFGVRFPLLKLTKLSPVLSKYRNILW